MTIPDPDPKWAKIPDPNSIYLNQQYSWEFKKLITNICFNFALKCHPSKKPLN